MSTAAAYQNHQHYLREGWSSQPKESFRRLGEMLAGEAPRPLERLLDVGCATGELIGYLQQRFEGLACTGVDVFAELLEEARRRLPQHAFVRGSVLELPGALRGQFDVVTAMGCMSIFDEAELGAFWDNLLGAARPGGLVVVLAPLNEYGCDTLVRHRKRVEGRRGAWETGWNVYSFETVSELLAARGLEVEFRRFAPRLLLPRRADPVRTWTLPTADNAHQLTNGLKLLVDHYFMLVKAPC